MVFVGAAIELIMVALYDNYIAAGNILAVMTTTSEEGGDFAKNSIHALPILIPALLVFLGLIFTRVKNGRGDKRMSWVMLITSTIIAAVFVGLQTNKAKQTLLFYTRQNVLTRPPYNLGYQIYNAYHQTQIRRLISDSEGMSFSATRPQIDGKEIYILAIGESSRYNSWSLMGYERETTPLLEKTEGLTAFTNYYSTATLTMFSVPQILTRATPSDFETNFKEKSIHKPFQECGFKTFAIVCKNLLSYETYLTSGTDSLFCVENDKSVPALIDSLSNIYEKTFFIVQFFGSHSFYSNYDKEREKYTPNFNTNPGSQDMDVLVNSYDNTILYTDYILSSIIRSIDHSGTTAGLIFVSDHGEDFRPGTGGHGGTSQPSAEEYHVPLIVWNSRLWIEQNKEKKDNSEMHKDAPLSGDNIFYSVCDMANITMGESYSREEWSLFSPKFQSHQRLLLLPDGTSTHEVQ